jgi:2-polyprenyl-6-methoxyphenol hydroxylase-like FAD-dependent oxidoreductase
VIVGAGPAGAALAYLLARQGIPTTLVERQTDFAREFRGEALQASGVDAVRQMGLGGALDALPSVQVDALEVWRAARRLFRISVGRFGVVGPRMISQPALLEMLVAEAGRHPSFRLARGVTVRSLVVEGGRTVGVRADGHDGALDLRADLVVGTDGRSSIVRARAGLDAVHAPQAFDIVWCKVPYPSFLEPAVMRAYLGHGHGALMYCSYDGRLQLAWVIEKGTFGELRRQGIEGWVREMAAHVGPELGAHLVAQAHAITQPFLLNVVSDRVSRWTAPGLLLIGDAAHPMSPVGAQGINIALRDTLVAANHLSPVLRGGAAPEAIDAAARAVEAERAAEVTQVQRAQQAPPRILFRDTWTTRLLIEVVAPVLFRTGLAYRLFAPAMRAALAGVSPVKLVV